MKLNKLNSTNEFLESSSVNYSTMTPTSSSPKTAAQHFNVINQNFGPPLTPLSIPTIPPSTIHDSVSSNSLYTNSRTRTNSVDTVESCASDRTDNQSNHTLPITSINTEYEQYRRQLARLPKPIRALNPPPQFRNVDVRKNLYTWTEIGRHNRFDDCWLVVRGRVYDVTAFLPYHPAGSSCIVRQAATEASEHYDFHSKQAHILWSDYCIGVVDGYEADQSCTIL